MYSEELESIIDRIYRVKVQIDSMSLGKYGISEELGNIIGNTIQSNVIMKKYHTALKEAYVQYTKTEASIEEKYSGLTDQSKEKDKNTDSNTSNSPYSDEIEKLKLKYKNHEISDDELLDSLINLYHVNDYFAIPSYACVVLGKKYDPQKKEELVNQIAHDLIDIKATEDYIDKQYKEYEKRYASNYYDRNKNNHNTSYNVAPVDNPPKISREDFPDFLASEEAEKIKEKAYSGEELKETARTSVASLAAGALAQYGYSKYKGKANNNRNNNEQNRNNRSNNKNNEVDQNNLNSNSNDAYNYQQYKKSLIKDDVLENSEVIITGDKLGDKKLISELTKDGSSINDWAKMESTYSYNSEYGNGKIHYYKNLKTGEVSLYDAKMKVPVPQNLRGRLKTQLPIRMVFGLLI
ncbi:hypothetical protein [Anaeromicropila herbilytica]|uniref:Uncharacterized protein n=1 Tax=Anaeromicropila herbilytica TaxID=2785025 RepID=A0A7R7ENN5_9FIRM|nr:hypothetical protein [Anaeromicropila herbilytica]BCN32205.1 hypothetical protein bsdtb5_35000 [Anaeromicropila herbilytica]